MDDLRDRWRIEVQAALIGWHFAGAMSEGDTPRPTLPEWLDIREAFDMWLVSEPEEPESTMDSADLDTMVAFGWRDVNSD